MALFYIIFTVTVASAMTRALAIYRHRMLFRQGLAGDSSIHFTIIRQLKRSWRSRYIDQYLIRYEPMSYPTAYHRYCGIFPLGLIESHPWLPNLVLFVVSAVAFSVYFHYVSSILLGVGTMSATLVASAAFILLPCHYIFAGPGLAYVSLSERFLARISCGAFVACTLIASQFQDLPSLAMAVIAGAIGLMTALFARQALLFIAPAMALLLWNWWPLLTLLLALLLALGLSRSYFILSMKHTIQQWSLYASHTKQSAVIRANLVRLVQLSDLRKAHSLLGVLWRLIQHEPGRSLLYSPEIVLVFTMLAFAGYESSAMLGISVWSLAAPFVASISIFLLTATDRFNHLGECYRYLEYGLYLLTPMIFGLFAIQYPAYAWWILLALVIMGLPGAYVAYVILGKGFRWPERDQMQELIQAMDLPHDAVVFPVGMPVAADVCARRPDVKSFWYQPGLISKAIYADFIEGWPFLKLDGEAIIEKFDVTHAIVDKGYLQYLTGPCRLPGMTQQYENERYLGYRRMKPVNGDAAETVILERPAPSPANP
jgi:hypothetical protein